ncbi:methionine gamma-lyase [Oceanicaulis sp. UBA2681]|uniref:methionine gamma-lyase n=1 Tax=Oceanicaulis sp. UBA2681 TaxID=1947007 RepID=UPI002357B463|nr:methionine gamma-lyase [Oceanicaulis sp. UBA2681]
MDGSAPITRQPGFSTRAIHAGYEPAQEGGALVPPLHLSSTFAFETVEDAGAAFSGERPAHFYTRISNPTLDLLERRIADLEGAAAGVSFGSGMGAITSVLWSLLEPGDEILADKALYGCTFSFLNHGLARFGIKVRHVDMSDIDAVIAAFSDKTRVVYFETPANPTMTLVDIAAVSAVARAHDVLTVVDNTYATPLITRPIELGADVVVHSATKYLGGHGDLVAGIAVGSVEVMERVRLYGLKDMTGAALSPFNAMLILRGLKTLSLRMERHSQTGLAVARWLHAHPQVRTVAYPGLEDGPQYALAKAQMRHFGGMIAFELEDGYEAGVTMMNAMKLALRAVSLGDAETLIQHPASMTHSAYSPEERALHGISDGLVRLSVGLEDADDILADLELALMA